IARSVNIFLDKLRREAKSAPRESTSPLPPVGPGGPGTPGFQPPPPSEFKFTDSKPMAPSAAPDPAPGAPKGLPGAPPPRATSTPPPLRRAQSTITAIEDVF